MAHFAKYMMFKTLVASRRYASESSNNGVETFLSSHSLISLITVEVGINVEGRQKLPNH